MPGQRSRQGCDECRRRRRKCDEKKPTCEACAARSSPCHYPLRLVWEEKRILQRPAAAAAHDRIRNRDTYRDTYRGRDSVTRCTSQLQKRQHQHQFQLQHVHHDGPVTFPMNLPTSLPNGIPLPSRYRRLLAHFSQNVLPSLSCHPSINNDLCRGLIPATLHSPHLLSACLALSAAGLVSRGIREVDGIGMDRILGHLQSSGLTLLRTAMSSGHVDDLVVATCLIWCLTDVFVYRQDNTSSWRIHLHGIKAILDGNPALRYIVASESSSSSSARESTSSTRSAMRHLYLLYLSLQTLPFIPSIQTVQETIPSEHDEISHPAPSSSSLASSGINLSKAPIDEEEQEEEDHSDGPPKSPQIDGFLGYSKDLLHILQRIDQLSSSSSSSSPPFSVPSPQSPSPSQKAQALILHGKLLSMISLDNLQPPTINFIPPSQLSPSSHLEFSLCHSTFQQATLIHLLRSNLYSLPSSSPEIREACKKMRSMLSDLSSAQEGGGTKPNHTWVAMAMPLFTLGCEAYTEGDQKFVSDKVDELEACLGYSGHVGIMRGALREVWRVRGERGDMGLESGGKVCSGELLGKLNYNIILF